MVGRDGVNLLDLVNGDNPVDRDSFGEVEKYQKMRWTAKATVSYVVTWRLEVAILLLGDVFHCISWAYDLGRTFLPCWRPECTF